MKKFIKETVEEIVKKHAEGTIRQDDLLLARPDPRTNCMNVPDNFDLELRQRVLQDVPKHIHQVWVGLYQPPEDTKLMQQYALKHGYHYHLWTEKNVKQLDPSEEILQCISYQILRKNWRGLSNIMRYLAVHKYGGIYFDCDYVPKDNAPSPELLCTPGQLSLTLEWGSRKVAKAAIMVENSFLAAPPQNEILTAVIKALPENQKSVANSWLNDQSVVSTGPFLLNKCLHGKFVVVYPTSIYHYFDRVNHNHGSLKIKERK